MKNLPPPLKVASPCPKQWEEMTGDAKRRFCEHCQLHVHNLSAMSERERGRFVEETKGKACIAYVVRPDGAMLPDGFWTRVLRPLRGVRVASLAVLATLLPFWFSSCATRKNNSMVKGKVQTVSDTSRSDRKGAMLLGEAPTVKTHPDASQMTLGVPAPPDSRR
jgi:hypothetical protein